MARPGREAISFLTPLGGAVKPSPAALAWFPMVGAALGLALGGVWWAAARIWPPAVSAALVVAADLVFTGLLHFDGLVDTADGLLPPMERGRRLDVMADPSAGAFGVGVAGAVLLLRWAALASLRPQILLLSGLWCASRTVMAVTARALPYARSSGLASAFGGGAGRRSAGLLAIVGLTAAIVLTIADRDATGLVCVVGVAAAGAAIVALAVRRLGGFTGDVLGAAGVVGETVGLLLAAARW